MSCKCHTDSQASMQVAEGWGNSNDYLFQESLGFKRCCYQHRHSTVHVCTVKYRHIICPKMSFFKRNEEPQTTQSSSVGWSETWKHENVEKTQAKQMTRQQNYGSAYCINHPEIRPCISRCITGGSLGSRPKGASTRSSRAPCARIHTKLSLKHCQLQSIKHSFFETQTLHPNLLTIECDFGNSWLSWRHTSQCVLLFHFVLSEIGPESRCNSNKTGY